MKNTITKNLPGIALILLLYGTAFSQANNISLQGENYVSLQGGNFPAKITWDQLSADNDVAGSYPTVSYWFVKPADAHIIVHLSCSTGGSIFIELSGRKSVYNFPADYATKDYRYNNFSLSVADNSGTPYQLTFGNGVPLTIRVTQLDPLHLSLAITGFVSVSGSVGKMAVTGKVTLQKQNAALAHLPDSYPGCDNTIYDTWSPHADLGQWRSATECEESFYFKLFTNIKTAFGQAYASLAAKGWMVNAPAYAPVKIINRSGDDNNSYFTMPRPYYQADANADPMKGEYHDYMQKVMSLSQSGNMTQLQELSDKAAGRYELVVHVVVNKKVETSSPLDFTQAQVHKLSDSVFVVSGVKGDYKGGAGTYIFIGHWGDGPQWENGYFTSEPMLPEGAPKLHVGALYVTLGCNDELASVLLKQIDMNKLTRLLNTRP